MKIKVALFDRRLVKNFEVRIQRYILFIMFVVDGEVDLRMNVLYFLAKFYLEVRIFTEILYFPSSNNFLSVFDRKTSFILRTMEM